MVAALFLLDVSTASMQHRSHKLQSLQNYVQLCPFILFPPWRKGVLNPQPWSVEPLAIQQGESVVLQSDFQVWASCGRMNIKQVDVDKVLK